MSVSTHPTVGHGRSLGYCWGVIGMLLESLGHDWDNTDIIDFPRRIWKICSTEKKRDFIRFWRLELHFYLEGIFAPNRS